MTYNKAINILRNTKYDTTENKAKKDMAIKFLDKQGFFRSDIEKLAYAISDVFNSVAKEFFRIFGYEKI